MPKVSEQQGQNQQGNLLAFFCIDSIHNTIRQRRVRDLNEPAMYAKPAHLITLLISQLLLEPFCSCCASKRCCAHRASRIEFSQIGNNPNRSLVERLVIVVAPIRSSSDVRYWAPQWKSIIYSRFWAGTCLNIAWIYKLAISKLWTMADTRVSSAQS